MQQSIVIEFLRSFFNLFNAQIENYEIVSKRIEGTVCWIDENDKQDFVFKNEFEASLLLKTKLLCDFLKKENLIKGDEFTSSEAELLQTLKEQGWQISEANEAISCLCSLDIKMLDEGEETDSFFLHF